MKKVYVDILLFNHSVNIIMGYRKEVSALCSIDFGRDVYGLTRCLRLNSNHSYEMICLR
jgi:hypothetical protein